MWEIVDGPFASHSNLIESAGGDVWRSRWSGRAVDEVAWEEGGVVLIRSV